LISRILPLDELTSPLTVTLTRANSLWVKCLDPAAIDSIAVLDADGDPVKVEVRRGSDQQHSLRLPLQNGRTEAFILPTTAVSVVGYRGDEIVRRVDVPTGGGELVF